MSDVFISYHEKSAGELAEQIANALDDAGISAWCARRDMLPGEVFAEEIPKRIHECRLFLLILNEHVYGSAHIRTEVGIAFSRVHKGENIRIFPLNVEECPLKGWLEYYLIHPQGVKFPAQPNAQHLQRLVKRVAKAFNHEPQSTSNIIKRGDCGENVTYTLNENGLLTISGQGPMWNFVWDEETKAYDIPWWNECQMISNAEILDGVASIGKYAFSGCQKLANVYIANSVTYIGKYAFSGCKELASIHIPSGVTHIERYAFSDCKGLSSIRIPDSVTVIGRWAFSGCTKLSVSVSAKTKIGRYAFPANIVRVTRRG